MDALIHPTFHIQLPATLFYVHIFNIFRNLIAPPMVVIPIRRNGLAERRIRPLRGGCGQTMLDGVVMDVIDIPPPIVLVPDSMFPEPALPDVFFTGAFAVCADALGDVIFDFPPTPGKIVVVFRQLPKAMEVVGQYDYGINGKRPGYHDVFERFPQQIDMLRFGENRPPLVGDNGKEIAATWDE
jgi:hypothetical protein